MSPDDAPSMIAMKRMGEVFEEGSSNSSAMIVLEGQEPPADAHGPGTVELPSRTTLYRLLDIVEGQTHVWDGDDPA